MSNKAVGDNIRFFREARGLLQKELAEMVGKKPGTISNWELGLRDPGANNIKLLAAALEISPSELIGHNPSVRQDSTFEIVCTDGSMLPEIRPGDRLVVSRTETPKDGDVVVASLRSTPNAAPVVRSLVMCSGISLLIPLHRVYPYEPESEFSIRGKVVELVRKF